MLAADRHHRRRTAGGIWHTAAVALSATTYSRGSTSSGTPEGRDRAPARLPLPCGDDTDAGLRAPRGRATAGTAVAGTGRGTRGWEGGRWDGRSLGRSPMGRRSLAGRPDDAPGAARYPVFLTVFLILIQVLGCLLASRGETTGTELDQLGFGLLIAGPVVLILRRRGR